MGLIQMETRFRRTTVHPTSAASSRHCLFLCTGHGGFCSFDHLVSHMNCCIGSQRSVWRPMSQSHRHCIDRFGTDFLCPGQHGTRPTEAMPRFFGRLLTHFFSCSVNTAPSDHVLDANLANVGTAANVDQCRLHRRSGQSVQSIPQFAGDLLFDTALAERTAKLTSDDFLGFWEVGDLTDGNAGWPSFLDARGQTDLVIGAMICEPEH
jgi:hypothetical protein